MELSRGACNFLSRCCDMLMIAFAQSAPPLHAFIVSVSELLLCFLNYDHCRTLPQTHYALIRRVKSSTRRYLTLFSASEVCDSLGRFYYKVSTHLVLYHNPSGASPLHQHSFALDGKNDLGFNFDGLLWSHVVTVDDFKHLLSFERTSCWKLPAIKRQSRMMDAG